MSVTARLTGRTRYRVHKLFFGKQILVLQVEEHREGYRADEHGHGEEINFSSWRDAKPEDITTQAKP
jgi:hypothetical protein